MSLVDISILILTQGIICALCFVLGARVGQKVVRGESLEKPKSSLVNPITEWNENKQAKKEQEKNRIIAENIDSYNGTPYGQQEIPK
jgi:hypothetical protein